MVRHLVFVLVLKNMDGFSQVAAELNCIVNAGQVGSLIVLERSHPAVPNVEKGAVVVTHVGVVVVMMCDVVEPLEHPVTRHPAWDHFVAGVARDVDHRIVR